MNYQIGSVLLKINVGFSHDQIYIYNKQFTNMFKIHRLQIYKKKTLKKQPNKQTIQKNKKPTFFTQWPNISGCTSCKTGSTDSRALYRILTMTTCIITVVSIMTNVTFCEKNDGT